MTRSILAVLMAVGALVAAPADARFGKKSSGSSGSSSSSSSSSSGSRSNSFHGAAPARSGGAQSGRSTGYVPNYRPGGNRWYYGAGYYGGYAPIFGLGWGAGYRAGTRYGYAQPVVTPQYADDEPEDEEPIRVTAGVDAMVFVQTQSGFTLGINGGFEIDRWGFNVAAQNISVASDDGSLTVDQLQQLNLHLTFAAITGSYGRLKLEAGADTFWAQDLTVLAPTIGLSGFVLIAGPLAIEGSVMVTPFPVRQLDVRAGLAVGLGPFGIRAGWRTQILDDQGLVDGVVHQDTFMGPYLGVGLAI